MEQSSIPVYIHSEEGEAKVAGKLIVDAKVRRFELENSSKTISPSLSSPPLPSSQCIIYIASEGAAKNNVGQDLISLAYISNKSISVVAEMPKNELMKSFVVGM